MPPATSHRSIPTGTNGSLPSAIRRLCSLDRERALAEASFDEMLACRRLHCLTVAVSSKANRPSSNGCEVSGLEVMGLLG